MPVSSPTFRVRISGPEPDVRRFLVEQPMEVQSVESHAGRLSVDLSVSKALLQEIARRGLSIDIALDTGSPARSRRKDVGTGNRFEDGSIPKGVGIKR